MNIVPACRGTFRIEREDGHAFDCRIPPFSLGPCSTSSPGPHSCFTSSPGPHSFFTCSPGPSLILHLLTLPLTHSSPAQPFITHSPWSSPAHPLFTQSPSRRTQATPRALPVRYQVNFTSTSTCTFTSILASTSTSTSPTSHLPGFNMNIQLSGPFPLLHGAVVSDFTLVTPIKSSLELHSVISSGKPP